MLVGQLHEEFPGNIEGMSFHNGTLYGITTPGGLYTLDRTTGTANLVAETGVSFFGGAIEFDSSGNLFGLTGSEELVTIDPLTGATSVVGPLGGFPKSGLAFDDTGTLYAVRSELYTVDTTTVPPLSSVHFIRMGSLASTVWRSVQVFAATLHDEVKPCIQIFLANRAVRPRTWA
jgi:hypothetical protein